MKKIDWFILLFLILFSCVALFDLFRPGFFTSHDGIHQVVRLYYFDEAIREGQIPPRWSAGLLNRFGYPLFIFSYHLPWIIAEPLHLAGLSIFDSIKMTFLIGFILSGITMYIFQKEIFGRKAAFVGSFLYLFAPYRFSNIFVRAAIGDATIFIFPPLLFLALFQLKKDQMRKWRWIILAAFSLAGMLLSHAMVFLFFFLATLLYILYSSLFIKKRTQFFFLSSIMLLLSFGLSSYYFLPSLLERDYTRFKDVMGNIFIGKTFLTFKELLYSPWGYGVMHASEGGMSFQLGLAQWVVLLFSIGLFIFLIVKRKKEKDIVLFSDMLFFLFLSLFSIILMLPFSLPIWQLLSKIALIDFTWRVLPVTVFTVAILTGFLISRIKYSSILALCLIILATYGNRNHLKRNATLDWELPFYLKLERTTNSYDEYTPKWTKDELVKDKKLDKKVEFSVSDAQITIQKENSTNVVFQIDTPKEGIVRVNTVYYPGWNVFVNSKPQKIDFEGSGLIEFPLEKGNSNVVIRFSETPFRMVSNIITLVSIVVSFLLLKRYKYHE